jgi:hypothetical protein
MAEPVSPLPVSPQKTDPIPWPTTAGQKPDQPSPAGLLPQAATAAAPDRLHELQSSVGRILDRVTMKMRQLRRERPIQIIVAAAVASFALGCALRMWRSRYE